MKSKGSAPRRSIWITNEDGNTYPMSPAAWAHLVSHVRGAVAVEVGLFEPFRSLTAVIKGARCGCLRKAVTWSEIGTGSADHLYNLDSIRESEANQAIKPTIYKRICPDLPKRKEARHTIKPNIIKRICLYLHNRLKFGWVFTWIERVRLCVYLPRGASLGSLRWPRSAFEGGLRVELEWR